MDIHSIRGQCATIPPDERTAGLSAAKRALLEFRLKKGGRARRPDVVPRRDEPNFVALSFAQELMWLLDQLNPNLSVYSVPRAMRIRGDLNVAALQKALDTIVARHEVLRTTFTTVNGEPVQVIGDSRPVDLPVRDLSQVPGPEQEAEVQRILTQEARHPFDFARDLLMRALLVRLAAQEHIFLLTTHHIASDGWSKMVLFNEFKALYAGYCSGQPAQLPELPIQYADFAVWQRRALPGEILEKQLAYWKRKLAGAPTFLALPTDYPRPAVQTFRGAGLRVFFPKSLLEELKVLSQKEEATLFMTLLATFNVLLYRYSGQEDILLGTPIAGRNRPETEGLIGYFTNTLILRTELSGNPTFRELLRRVRETALEAYDNQDFPFEKLVVELRPERDLSYSPGFQVLFSVGHAGMGAPDLPGLSVSPLDIDRGIAKFDLTVGMTEVANGLGATCEYSTDLFHRETIQRMLMHLQTLLEAVVADPDRRLSELPLLTKAERRQLLIEWNATQTDFPQTACVHELIEAQVQRTPEAPAVLFRDRQLTYRELNARANQLAHYLRQRGVGPEGLVGLCVERSLEMAVGLLGILKAGAAYVPLDPAYPSDRLAFMLEDARVPVLLTQQHLREQLPGKHPAVVCLDTDWPAIARASAENPATPMAPDHPAYVIYTSGSTGWPRGVIVTHRSLVNHNLAAQKVYGIGPNDRVLQFASLSFDIAVEEILPSWVAGAAVVLHPGDLMFAGRDFLRWIGQNQISVLNLPTAFWHEWVHQLATLQEALPPTLRLVIVGGEKALAEVFATWRKIVGDRVRWINTYGPTEATVIATVHEPTGPTGAAEEITELPMGRPIANTQVYILDRYLQPVPIGVSGELYLGGVGLARGYLNRPELTAAKFIPNPFSSVPGERLYQTGDLVRYRQDGSIEFMGRNDDQVKIRGFRIELGEIEGELCRHPDVRAAVVMAREDVPGAKRLVAYVATGSETPVPARSLQSYLRERLPEYMVPTKFVSLATFPKTPNGKVDRRALPAPVPEVASPEKETIAARDPMELQLVMLWENVLGVKSVGIRDNFFELGGHSLLAVRLLTQMTKVFGKTLPLATLFRAPTVEQLAEFLRQEADSCTWDTLIPIQPSGSRPPFFCVAAPKVNALGFVFLARHLGPDQPVYGLQSQYGGKRQQLYSQAEYQTLAGDYIAAMRKVQPQGPYYFGGTCEGAHIAFEMTRQLTEAGQPVGLLAMLDAWPLENSTSYFLHTYVHYYSIRLRSFFRRSGRENLARIQARAKMLLRKLAGLFAPASRRLPTVQTDPAVGNPMATSVVNWKARLWPGKDFVPPTIPGRITVFRIHKQPYWRPRDQQLGWGPWTRSGVDVHEIPGRHSLILREPHVQVLAKLLSECLSRAARHDTVDQD